jgi:uncharacterized membrane protein
MIEIPLHADVECTDGVCAESWGVIINRASRQVVAFIINLRGQSAGDPLLLDAAQVATANATKLQLRCGRDQLLSLSPFIEPAGPPEPTTFILRRDMPVRAADGEVGELDHLLADDAGAAIISVVLREGRKQAILPLDAVGQVDAKNVYLKLNRQELAALPSMALPRRRSGSAARVDLLGITYETTDQAAAELEKVRAIKHYSDLRILDAAIVIKQADGEVQIQDTAEWTAKRGGWTGALAGGLAGMLLGPAGVVIGALAGAGIGGIVAPKIDRGLSNTFLQNFGSKLTPGGSGLVLMVEHEWTDRALAAFARDRGAVVTEELVAELAQDVVPPDADGPQQI